MCLFELWFSLGICPVVGLLGHLVVLVLVFFFFFFLRNLLKLVHILQDIGNLKMTKDRPCSKRAQDS